MNIRHGKATWSILFPQRRPKGKRHRVLGNTVAEFHRMARNIFVFPVTFFSDNLMMFFLKSLFSREAKSDWQHMSCWTGSRFPYTEFEIRPSNCDIRFRKLTQRFPTRFASRYIRDFSSLRSILFIWKDLLIYLKLLHESYCLLYW